MSEVRLRFAPSPTGYVHIGSLRTALYDYLFANQKGGKYILRIEDTDRSRYVEGAVENMVQSLLWAGVKHDEGVFIEDGKLIQKGEYGPYIQSERLDIYKKYIDELIQKGKAYYCFCSKERLDKVREEQKEQGVTPMYDKYCRNSDKTEAESRIKAGEEYTIRLRVPENKDITFEDLVKGNITINTDEIDDQVLIKTDGFPTYHFAVVVDDYLMKITHVVRGDEWLVSTPKQIILYQAFGWKIPEFIHLPTVLNKDKKKLSKRQGDVAVSDFQKKGYLPEALCNYLALVGWSPEDNQEILTMDEMVKQFSFNRVSKTGGVFDLDKLNWVNGQHIRKSDLDRITKLAIPYLIDKNYITKEDVNKRYDWIKAIIASVQEKISYISEITDKIDIFFKNEIVPENDEAGEMLKKEQVPDLLQALKNEILQIDEVDDEFVNNIFKVLKNKTGIKGKNLFMPTRIVLTGQLHGPDMGNIIKVLGKQNILKRIEYVERNLIK